MKKIALSLGLISILCLLFWAFRTPQVTVYLDGRVLSNDDVLTSVEVSLCDNQGNPTGYYEPTNENGKFSLQFNIEKGEPLKLKFQKEGYGVLVKDFLPSSNSNQFSLEDIHLVRLMAEENNSVEKLLTNSRKGKNQSIRIYPEMESSDYAEYYEEEIKYFSFIEKDICLNDSKGCWYKVSLAVETNSIEKDINGWHFSD